MYIESRTIAKRRKGILALNPIISGMIQIKMDIKPNSENPIVVFLLMD